ncbi:hypothetical protein [Paenibacillus medicaginis]|uniref:Uncharacterized protein n=1 Tax=Paenibacillus medicaginis TaxID=1470560 RepID=A0ABV5BUI3_9BACL
MFNSNTAEQIIDHITERIDTLNGVNKEVSRRLGHKDETVNAKTHELEDIRSWITANFF